jgi:hypothetical protein
MTLVMGNGSSHMSALDGALSGNKLSPGVGMVSLCPERLLTSDMDRVLSGASSYRH